jgi:hypothetical protein
MARSARASAHAPVSLKSAAKASAAPSPAPSAAPGAAPSPDSAPAPQPFPRQDSAESLALQADDDIESIRDVHCACEGLEKLIAPQRVNDCEEIYPTRSELSALVRLVNEALQRRIDAAQATVQAMRGALRKGSAQ